jgi:hypothetical protein
MYLTPKGARIYGFKMTTSIVKNIIQMRPNLISPESVKNIACVGHTTNKFEQKEVHTGPTQNC